MCGCLDTCAKMCNIVQFAHVEGKLCPHNKIYKKSLMRDIPYNI